MSNFIYYAPKHPIKKYRLLDGCLEKYKLQILENNDEFPHIYMNEDKSVTLEAIHRSLGMVEFRSNTHPENESLIQIINFIKFEFGTEIYSSKQPEYYGYRSLAEAEADFDNYPGPEDRFIYESILKSLALSSCIFSPDTARYEKYEIAQKILANDPYLILPIHKDTLLKKIYSVYRDRALEIESGASDNLIKEFAQRGIEEDILF
jgi:hypothetical protein